MILLGLCAQHLSSLIMYHSRIPGGSVILALHFQVKKNPAFWLKKNNHRTACPSAILKGPCYTPKLLFLTNRPDFHPYHLRQLYLYSSI